jgi:hypothetical protein
MDLNIEEQKIFDTLLIEALRDGYTEVDAYAYAEWETIMHFAEEYEQDNNPWTKSVWGPL